MHGAARGARPSFMPGRYGTDGAARTAGNTRPQGPQGLPGPAGPPGQTRLNLTATVGANGTATVTLPAAAGSDPARPPAVACYISSNPATGVWVAVNDGYWIPDTPWYGMGLAGGIWRVTVHDAPVGWTAAFVVVY